MIKFRDGQRKYDRCYYKGSRDHPGNSIHSSMLHCLLIIKVFIKCNNSNKKILLLCGVSGRG